MLVIRRRALSPMNWPKCLSTATESRFALPRCLRTPAMSPAPAVNSTSAATRARATMPACNWNLPPGLSIQLTQGEDVDLPGRGSAKATSASFAVKSL